MQWPIPASTDVAMPGVQVVVVHFQVGQ